MQQVELRLAILRNIEQGLLPLRGKKETERQQLIYRACTRSNQCKAFFICTKQGRCAFRQAQIRYRENQILSSLKRRLEGGW